MWKMRSAWRSFPARTLALLASLGWGSIAHAQTGTIAGTVIDAKSGQPLPDAQVIVVGSTEAGARSGTRGEFRLTNVTGTTVKLRATRIGFQAATHDARVGDTN
ncbi:MAG: carboxypeptidase regulatory-like domain-containing protein, partial [Gemmatimonadaceae bacterium]